MNKEKVMKLLAMQTACTPVEKIVKKPGMNVEDVETQLLERGYKPIYADTAAPEKESEPILELPKIPAAEKVAPEKTTPEKTPARSKLTDAERDEIIKIYTETGSSKEAARRTSRSISTVNRVIKAWREEHHETDTPTADPEQAQKKGAPKDNGTPEEKGLEWEPESPIYTDYTTFRADCQAFLSVLTAAISELCEIYEHMTSSEQFAWDMGQHFQQLEDMRRRYDTYFPRAAEGNDNVPV